MYVYAEAPLSAWLSVKKCHMAQNFAGTATVKML
jgi:hypothetical protein